MKYSLRIGRPFGIKISIHWTFLLLIAWVVIVGVQQGLNLEQTLLSIFFVLTLFVCVVLHELGHSLAAMHYGADVRSITLLPIGGMANISKMPEKPKQELVVTVAGLAVNVVIAFILFGVISITGGVNPEQMDFTAITTTNFLVMLMLVNLFVVAFNLIPAFPMDGGRILRSLFSMKMDRLKATRWAKNTGQAFAALFVITGLFINPFLVVIGIFVFIGAGAEYNFMKMGKALKTFVAGDALITDYLTLSPDETLEAAAEKIVHYPDSGILVMEGDQLRGILTGSNIIKGLSEHGKDAPVSEVMSAEFETVAPEKPLEKVFRMMQSRRLPLVPVMKNGKVRGILDKDNLHQFILVRQALDE